MKKVFKYSTMVTVFIMVMFFAVLIVKADGQWYNSYLYISDNSTHSGPERTYSYDYYKLEMTPSSLELGSLSTNNNVRLHIELIRPLYRFGIKYGEEVKYSGNSYFNKYNDIGVTKNIYLGNCADGKRYLYFSTWGTGYNNGYGSYQGSVDIYNYS